MGAARQGHNNQRDSNYDFNDNKNNEGLVKSNEVDRALHCQEFWFVLTSLRRGNTSDPDVEGVFVLGRSDLGGHGFLGPTWLGSCSRFTPLQGLGGPSMKPLMHPTTKV